MNDLVKLSEIFDVIYGVNLELVHIEQCTSTTENAIPFVSRTEKNNGVSAYVYEMIDIEPNPKHTLSVAGGGSVLSTFYQPKPYYSGRDLYVLIPKKELSVVEMLFYTKCISSNKYKYSYGRQANKTMKDLLIPKKVPNQIIQTLSNYKINLENDLSKKEFSKKKESLNIEEWKYYNLLELFKIEKGERLTKYDRVSDDFNLPLVTASSENNGVVNYISYFEFRDFKKIFQNKITIDMFFNVFFQPKRYFSDDNVHTLIPRFKTNKFISLFIVSVLRKYQNKYSYGRQARIHRIEKEKIYLPSKNNKPDFEFMENYIKSLPYSKTL